MARRMNDKELAKVIKDKSRRDDSTIDNNATTAQMIFLARLYRQTKDIRYRDAFLQGVEYLLSGQYENGGWPQFWPGPRGYQVHITFNDDAIVNTLNMIRDMMNHKAPYEDDLIDKTLCVRLGKAFNKGIECILATQIIKDGEPSVWCQQNDRETLKPAPARAYELPSYCSAESAGIVRLLMELPAPDARVKRAVHGAMKWFDRYKLTGLKCERIVLANGERDTRLVEDPQAKPIWARYYDLKYCEPYVCDRDGLPRRHLEEIGTERRNGYSWYNSRPAELFAIYNAWADKYDPKHKVAISLATKGANENGLIEMYRRPMAERTAFDVVVKPGESIQAAIEKAPEIPTVPFKILLLNGTYHQKVIIDRPNIVLVGENRDSTRIVLAETAQTRAITEYHGRPVGNGVIVLQEGADDCVISGLTVYNNYGTAVENTTIHQMAIFLPKERTYVSGSPMAEVLHENLKDIEASDIHARLGLEKGKYILLSAHREENIDTEKNFFSLFNAINAMAAKYDMPILYSCHPRSRKRLEASGFQLDKRVLQHEPLGFHDYNCLQMNAFAVVSDSGTLPEESSFFTSVGHPFPAICIRTSTERPESLDKAGFVLAGIDEKSLLQAVDTAIELHQNGDYGTPVPTYTDENVSIKMVKLIQSYTGVVNKMVWRKE